MIGGLKHHYSYDRAGNLTQESWSGNTRTYQYDALNQLRSVRHNGTLVVRYGYDVLGRRIAKRVYSGITGGTVGFTRYKYHGSHVAFETDSAGSNIGWRYTWGMGTDDLLALRDAAGNHYYTAKDKLGSIRALAERDGTWKYSTRYGPYGEPKTGAGTDPGLRYRWTGREYDAETGWYFHRSRYYAPTMLRFVQEDKIGYGGGANLYAYVAGAVLDARDPSGMLMAWGDVKGFVPFCTAGGSCLTAYGSVIGGAGGSMSGIGGGGGGGGGGRGLIDNDNNGLDDFEEFADYAFARLRWSALNLGTDEQWLRIQWALDRMPDQGFAGRIRNFMQFGRLSVTDLGNPEVLGYEENFRIQINSTGAFGLPHYQWDQLDELQFTLAHEYGHILQRVWNKYQGSDCSERGANIIATKALGFDRSHGLHPYWSGC